MVTIVPLLFHFILCSNILFKTIDSQQDGELKLLSKHKPVGFFNSGKKLPKEISKTAKFLVDGDTSQDMKAGASCGITYSDTPNEIRWYVNLDKSYKIKKVVIYGRTDCCQTELIGTKIQILKSPSELLKENSLQENLCGATIDVVRDGAIYTFNCDLEGEIVKIWKETIGLLTICEVEVFGTD